MTIENEYSLEKLRKDCDKNEPELSKLGSAGELSKKGGGLARNEFLSNYDCLTS